ncbi:hypothetical protein cypCar_00047716 [Cyprinus carpio]|nr:hypothetical protein cypCar_00047716 [Cyprinus carpio]
MKKMFLKFLLLCLWHLIAQINFSSPPTGVFGYEVRISVNEGESITLNSGLTEIQTDDDILWTFRNDRSTIAIINRVNKRILDNLDGRFRDRLQLDHQTGSLTITNSRMIDSGLYEVTISRSSNLETKYNSMFDVSVYERFVETDTKKSVMEGDSVTLHSGRTYLNDDWIQWWFMNKNNLIAEINVPESRFSVYYDVLDGRFRDRLELDYQTGSLTITNITTEHTGVYELEYNTRSRPSFYLSVYSEFDDILTPVSVKEGDSVTLNSGLTEIMDDGLILWVCSNKFTLIAEINKRADSISVQDDALDGRFRDRLKLDKQTGSLTITNTTTEDTRFCQLHINRMKKIFILTVYGVIGDEMKSVSVMEGDSVTLNSGLTDLTEIRDDDLIQWLFVDALIAFISKVANVYTVFDNNGKFSNRLKLDHETGSLTITDIKIRHAGLYKLQINSVVKSFILTVNGGVANALMPVSVMEGDSVTLNTGLTEIQTDHLILWTFENKNTIIADVWLDRFSVYNDVLDGRFRDRLKLDKQTGSLTITDTRTQHAGYYELQTTRMMIVFSLKVYGVTDAVKSVSVLEGDSVTLNSGLTEIDGDVFQWVFINSLIAHINVKADHITIFDYNDGRFRDRLKLDKQTGSLTITDTRNAHSGLYELLTYREAKSWKFSLTVYGEFNLLQL